MAAILLALVVVTPAFAEVKYETFEYKDGATILEGYLAWDDAIKGERPGVLVFHQWRGLSDYERMRARQLAEMGYVAFAADIYGKGVRPATVQEAGATSGKYKESPELFRRRANLALDALRKHTLSQDNNIGAIGYCFGGAAVLELARSGAVFNAGVSFHGSYKTSLPAKKGEIKPALLVVHGADDPFTNMEELDWLMDELNAASADWQAIVISGAQHAFTDPDAKGDLKGAKYDERAAHRAWEAMKVFFGETLK
ncbi:dienelactone hydrolase family protein [bacterium]|nr:dienelactone hydrolase family protein [bacterium]